MRGAYRQADAGPIVNLARHPRGTQLSASAGQWPKWQIDRWGGDGSYSPLTGAGGHPEGITTAIRFTITTNARSSHGFHLAGNPEQNPPGIATNQMIPAQPGEQLTISCWLRYGGSVSQAYRIRFRSCNSDGSAWIDAGPSQLPVPLPSGVWIPLSFTYTVPAGASFVSASVQNGNGVLDVIGDTIDATGLMVTRTPALRANIASDPYATKSTISNGRFGWVPRWFGSGGATGTTTPITDASDGPEGIRTYLRKTWTALGGGPQDVGFTHTANGVRATQGDVFTISSYIRASKGWTVTQNCRLVIAWYDGTGTQIGANIQGPNVSAAVAGTWHKMSVTATAPANTVTMFAYQLVYVQNAAWAPGDTLDGTGLIVTRTPPRWSFRDGNSPGWRWLGAVNASESAGYPVPL